MVDFERALEVSRWQSEISLELQEKATPWNGLKENLRDHLPRTYHDYRRAYTLFLRLARDDSLMGRQKAATEIGRLAPRDFSLPNIQPAQEGNDDMKTTEMFPSKYLKADDLPDGYRNNLTLESFSLEPIEMDNKTTDKPVVYFKGGSKGLVLNRTNADALSDITGSIDSDDWMGVVVSVFKTKVRYGEKRVNAIRIDPAQVQGQAPATAALPTAAVVTEPDARAATPTTAAFRATDDDVPF